LSTAWWAANEATYPNIAHVAHKLLAMPATSVTSERRFSKAGDNVTELTLQGGPSNLFDGKLYSCWVD